jgi:thiol-disulfide isomerase/thioredoxin
MASRELWVRCWITLLVALVITASPDVGHSTDVEVETCETKPFVVSIHADWCSTCRSLAPTWARIGSELGDQATIVKLDVSDRVAFEASQAEARRLGIAEFFHEYRSQTGTIAVLDCRTREPVAVLRGERDMAKYREAIARARHSS